MTKDSVENIYWQNESENILWIIDFVTMALLSSIASGLTVA